jgi:flavin reductase (DIM6/NTAB) family NADH-FMN oxidoreductase RutF
MIAIDPEKTPTRDFHQYLLGAVAPRPIAFVSTIDENGNPNLAPYSFYNAFSSNPPILVFSSNRRVVDNTTKDTLYNAQVTKETVINVVNYAIVRQMAVASVEFDSSISEFEKTGLTPIPSDLVKPFRVKESPVQMECRVKEIITLGEHGGAGHLIINEVLRMHVDPSVLDEKNRINPHKIDLMGRLGRAYYVRASGDAIHTIVQQVTKETIGYDGLPEKVRNSHILTGNDLGQLAGLTEFPAVMALDEMRNDAHIRKLASSDNPLEELHKYAAYLLAKDDRETAMKILLIAEDY